MYPNWQSSGNNISFLTSVVKKKEKSIEKRPLIIVIRKITISTYSASDNWKIWTTQLKATHDGAIKQEV